MSGELEVEFKLSLPDEEACERLLALLPPSIREAAPVLQVNHFFDTSSGELRKCELALRLRSEGDRYMLALKGPRAGAAGALHARPEEEVEIPAPEATAILGGARSPLEALHERLPDSELVQSALALVGSRPLSHLGAFRNERRRIGPVTPIGPGRADALVFELDRTLFPGERLEHELEVEVEAADAPAIEAELRALFRRADIEWRPAASKAERFFRILHR